MDFPFLILYFICFLTRYNFLSIQNIAVHSNCFGYHPHIAFLDCRLFFIFLNGFNKNDKTISRHLNKLVRTKGFFRIIHQRPLTLRYISDMKPTFEMSNLN